ncbi:MAG: hypothetical protein V1792_24215 [Pseudomonadota bacterium]
MNLLRRGMSFRFPALVICAFLLVPALSSAQEFSVFQSDQYGFSMKYPTSWIKIDKPKGNYYVVFQSPELTENFRNRIHVAAHKPVKDPLKVFLQELRNGIKDLQGKPGSGPEKQQVKILDEGEFRCEVPGAYYFFIQAYENKLKLWMDIVIVFYKHEDTLLRISCLAPSKTMEQFHGLFNTVLVSVNFQAPAASAPGAGPTEQSAPAPLGPSTTEDEAEPGPGGPSAEEPEAAPSPGETPVQLRRPAAPSPAPPAPAQPTVQPALPAQPTVQPALPAQPMVQPAPPAPSPGRPSVQPAPPAPRPGPRGPARLPEGPATGIVN